MDLIKASEVIKALITSLEIRREELSSHFEGIFKEAEEMAEKIDVEIRKPRTCRRQTLRENHDVDADGDCQTYYRVSVYAPLLDCVLSDLKTRFSDDVLHVFELPSLFPDNIIRLNSSELSQLSCNLLDSFADFFKLNKINNNDINALASEMDTEKK